MALSVKQEAFCIHYAQTGRASESYKAAGYEAKTPAAIYSNANRLLKQDKIKARLHELAEEIKSAKIADVVEMQEKLTAIMRGEEPETIYVKNADGTPEAVQVVNQWNQLEAIKQLAKMQGCADGKLQVEMIVPVFGGEDSLED